MMEMERMKGGLTRSVRGDERWVMAEKFSKDEKKGIGGGLRLFFLFSFLLLKRSALGCCLVVHVSFFFFAH